MVLKAIFHPRKPVVLGVKFMPPATRFYLDKLFTFIFLQLCSFTLKPLEHTSASRSKKLEIVLLVYLCGWLAQEVEETTREVVSIHRARKTDKAAAKFGDDAQFGFEVQRSAFKSWLIGQNVWNHLDQGALLMSIASQGLRYIEANWGPMVAGTAGMSYVSDVLIPLSLIATWLRFFELLAIDARVGPLIQVIIRVLSNDIINFIKLVALVLLARASAMSFLRFDHYTKYFDTDKTSWGLWPEFLLSFRILIQGSELKDPHELLVRELFPWLMETFFGLVLVILMVNLLIAMFTKTFDLISDNGTIEFMYMRAQIMQCRDDMP